MLLSMAVFDTDTNLRSWMTKATMLSLNRTVDWDRHRLIVSDNGSILATHTIYEELEAVMPFKVIYNHKNLGTANAINKAWRRREPGEHCVKVDNDCVIHQAGWADWMEDVFQRDVTIGICGLKRKDLMECPWHPEDAYRSTVRMLSHEKGQRWIVVEDVVHVMGTCQAYSSVFLDKIGYLVQPGLYGFDDSLSAVRAIAAGFKSVFLHGFEIDHIDTGATEYSEWKRRSAGKDMARFNELKSQYLSGKRPVHYDGGFSVPG